MSDVDAIYEKLRGFMVGDKVKLVSDNHPFTKTNLVFGEVGTIVARVAGDAAVVDFARLGWPMVCFPEELELIHE